MKKKSLETINLIFIIGCLCVIFLTKVLLSCFFVPFYIYSIILYLLALIAIPLVIVNFHTSKYNFKRLDLIIILLIIIALLATLLSKYKLTSVFGYLNRYEGLLTLLSYYTLLVLSSFVNKKKHQMIIDVIIILGILQIFYGFLEIFKIVPSPYDSTQFVKGLEGNSNFFGIQMVICFSLSLFSLITYKNLKYLLFTIITIIGIFLSGSMGTILSSFIIFISGIIYYIHQNKIRKKIIIGFIALLITIILIIGSIINFVFNNNVYKDIKNLSYQAYDIIVNQNLDNSYGSRRIFIWKHTIKILPKYIIHGIGIDCFAYAFPNDSKEMKNNGFIDKAHNEILQMCVTEGIFKPILYCILIFYSLNKRKNPILKSAILGYFIQSMFSISTITIAPTYYIILGLVNNRNI